MRAEVRGAFACLLLIAATATAQPPPAPGLTTLPAGAFAIGGERFAPEDIVDARFVPDIGGTPSIMVTFSEAAAKRLAALTAARVGQKLPMTLDGAVLSEPIVRDPITGGVAMIGGGFTAEEAAALARRISGKEPVPDELGE